MCTKAFTQRLHCNPCIITDFPENPIRYVVDNVHFTRLMLMMIPFWVLSIWLTLYGINVILCKLFNVVYNLCVEKKEKTVCSGEGCEHCAGRIFLKYK